MQVIRTRATWSKRLLLAAAVLAVIAAVADVQWYREPVRQAVLYVAVPNILQNMLVLATAIAFVSWSFGAYERLPTIGATPRFKTWRAIAGWFVPILNLIRPKQIVDETWKAGHTPALAVPSFVHLWWAVWILYTLVGTAADAAYDPADTSDEVRAEAVVLLVGDLLYMTAALLGVLVVERVTAGVERASDASS